MRRRLEHALVDSPVPLALLRVAVAFVVLISPELHEAVRLAGDPTQLGFPPEGLRSLDAVLTVKPGLARVLQIVAFSSAATSILGYRSRASLIALTVSAGLLFSLSQRSGAVLHDMHLFWMTALLAASPCADTLALDAWGKERPPPSLRYGVPLAFARLFLGLVYLFPGIHKLATSGAAWMTASNVIGHMQAKWLQYGTVPSLRLDQQPWLCTMGAIFVVAFEISFVVLAIATPRTRLVALVGGVVFHVTTLLCFFIPFTALWACYVVLLPARWVDRREADDRRPTRAPIVVGSIVAFAAIVQGVRGQTQAWPFACYPTFAHVQPHEIPDLLVEVTLRDGTTRRLTGREHSIRSQAGWGHVFRISGAYGETPAVPPLRDHARAVLASAVPPIVNDAAAHVAVRRVMVPTAPSRWTETPAEAAGVVVADFTEWRATTP